MCFFIEKHHLTKELPGVPFTDAVQFRHMHKYKNNINSVRLVVRFLSNASVLLSNWSAATVLRDATGNITDLVTPGVPCTGSAVAACELGYNFSSCAIEKCNFGLINNNQVCSI